MGRFVVVGPRLPLLKRRTGTNWEKKSTNQERSETIWETPPFQDPPHLSLLKTPCGWIWSLRSNLVDSGFKKSNPRAARAMIRRGSLQYWMKRLEDRLLTGGSRRIQKALPDCASRFSLALLFGQMVLFVLVFGPFINFMIFFMWGLPRSLLSLLVTL